MDEDNAEDGKSFVIVLMIEFYHATYFARGGS